MLVELMCLPLISCKTLHEGGWMGFGVGGMAWHVGHFVNMAGTQAPAASPNMLAFVESKPSMPPPIGRHHLQGSKKLCQLPCLWGGHHSCFARLLIRRKHTSVQTSCIFGLSCPSTHVISRLARKHVETTSCSTLVTSFPE